MVGIGFFKISLDAKNGMIKTVELRPCNVDVEFSKMVLDGLSDAL
jgi:hypothetical protein